MAVASSQPSQVKNRSIYINGRVGLILLASLGLNALLAFGLIWQIGNNAALATKEITLVQLQGGEAVLAEPRDADYREPEVILETAKTWFEMTYATSSVLPGGERDEGIKISPRGSTKVPTATYRASYLLPAGYRTVFLQEFASQFISNGFFKSGNRTSIARIWDAYIVPGGSPKDGWTVEIVATVVDLNGTQEVRETPVNLSLKLLPVIPNVKPLGEEDPSELRRAIADLREAGLAIASIEPLNL